MFKKDNLINILIQLFLWLLIFITPLISQILNNTPTYTIISNMKYYYPLLIMFLIIFYVNYFLFIPYILFKKRNIIYTLSNIILIYLLNILYGVYLLHIHLKDYVRIFLSDSNRPLIALTTMKAIAEKLPQDYFHRVHRSYIVALNKIEHIEHNRIKIGKEVIPVAESKIDALMSLINI